VDFSVYFRRIEPEAHAVLTALRASKSLSSAIEIGFKNSPMSELEQGDYVRHSFETWAALGWFCQAQ